MVAAFEAAHASAQPSAASEPIRLDVRACAYVSAATVHELVALEVAPRVVLAADSPLPFTTHAELECRAGVAFISVEDALNAAPLRLEITLMDLAAPARPRLLALALAELIATSWLGRSPPSAAESEAPLAPDAQSEEPASRAERSAGIWLGLGAARAAEPSSIAPSAALGGVYAWDWLGLSADLRFDYARQTQALAHLQLTAISLALVPVWRVHGRSAQLLVGPGLRAGYADLRANARESGVSGRAVAGFWLAPCAQVALHWSVARRWSLRLGAELGYVTQTVRGLDASGDPLFELTGLSLSAHAGLSWDAVTSR